MNVRVPQSPAIVRRILTVGALNGVSKLSLLGTEVFLAASLGAAFLGRFAIAQSLLLVVGMLAIFGTNLGVVRGIGAAQVRGDAPAAAGIAVAGWLICAVGGCLLGAAMWVAAPWLAADLLDLPELTTALRWVAVALPFEAVNQASAAIFRGFRVNAAQVLVADLLRNVAVLMVAVVSPAVRGDVTALVSVLALGTMTSTIYGLVRARTMIRGAFARGFAATIRDLLFFSWPLSIWNILQVASGRLQIVIVGAFLAATEVGVYSLLLRTLMVLTFVQSVVNHTVPVEFSALHERSDRVGLRRLYRTTSLGLLLVGTTLLLPVLADSRTVFGWIGPEYLEYHLLAVPLVLVQLLNVGTGPMGQLLVSVGFRSTLLGISTVTAALQIGGLLLFVPLLGLPGAVLAECLTVTFGTALRQFWGWRRVHVQFDVRRTLVVLGLSAGSILAGWIVAWGARSAAVWDVSPALTSMLIWLSLLVALPGSRASLRAAIIPRNRAASTSAIDSADAEDAEG